MKLFSKGSLNFGSTNFYVMIGSFAIIFMVYLWLAPKLVKKPAGTPPRSGSNEEKKQVAKSIAGIPPQPPSAIKNAMPPGKSAMGPPMAPTGPNKFRFANPAFANFPGQGKMGWQRPDFPRAGMYPFTGIHSA